jgi:hypothetical protein
VASAPSKIWGKIDINDWDTVNGSFKTFISSLHLYKKYAWFIFTTKICLICITVISIFVSWYRHLTAAIYNYVNASGSGNITKLRHYQACAQHFIHCVP